MSYEELGRTVSEIARGLIDLGIEPGERVSLLCSTRPEWTSCDFAISSAGAVVVPIYPTNSPSECEWVAGNSESVAIVCEDAAQVAKIVEVRENLPALEARDRRSTRRATWPTPSRSTTCASAAAAATRPSCRRAATAVTPDDTYTIIYTSGTTGPPKGCVLSHRNYRQVVNMTEEFGVVEEGDVIYLFLPLAHAYALLIQLLAIDLGCTIAYFGGDPKQIVPELMEVHPTYLPSVPRIFEKIYTLVTSNGDPEQIKGAVGVGLKVKALQAAGPGGPRRAPGPLRQGRRGAVRQRPQRVRRPAQAGQHRRRADRQGDPRVLLRLRRAGDGGLRHDGDRHGGHDPDDRGPPARLGRQGRCPAPRSGSPRTARS